jgi:hypothetical protein
VSVALTPDGVLEAVEPADVASTLVRREPLCLNLLFGCRDTRFQRLPLIVGRALPAEQSTSLVRRQDATWQLPAPQVLLQLFRSVSLWGLGHCPRVRVPVAAPRTSESSAPCAVSPSLSSAERLEASAVRSRRGGCRPSEAMPNPTGSHPRGPASCWRTCPPRSEAEEGASGRFQPAPLPRSGHLPRRLKSFALRPDMLAQQHAAQLLKLGWRIVTRPKNRLPVVDRQREHAHHPPERILKPASQVGVVNQSARSNTSSSRTGRPATCIPSIVTEHTFAFNRDSAGRTMRNLRGFRQVVGSSSTM